MRTALSCGLLAILLLAGSAEALGQEAFQPVVRGAVSPELYAPDGGRPLVRGPVVAPDWAPPPTFVTLVPDLPPPETPEPAPAVVQTFPFSPFAALPSSDVQAAAAMPAPAGSSEARPWLLPLLGLVVSAGAVLAMSTRARILPVRAKRRGTTRTVPVLTPVGPDDIDGLLRNGQAAAQRGDLDEATAWFRQAASVAPTLAVAHFCHGTCLWGSGRHESALRAYSRAVDLDPADGAARIQLARVQLAMGESQEAMVVLAPVLRDVPDFLDIMRADPDLAPLADHPVFLAMAGML